MGAACSPEMLVATNNATWCLNPDNYNLTNYYMQVHFFYLDMYFWTVIPCTFGRTDTDEINSMCFQNVSINPEDNTSHKLGYHK